MKRFLAALLLCSSLAPSVWSQTTTTPPQALSQVRQFLGLTDAQVSAILQSINDYNTFFFQQQQQIQNAQAQIAVETAKDSLDPMALGNLYAGIETACRDLRNKAATSQTQNISVLSDAHKAKLNMLSDAMKLAPIISEAQSANLLGPPALTPFFSDFLLGNFTSVIYLPTGASGCASPFPGNIIPSIRVPAGTSQRGAEGMYDATQSSPLVNEFFRGSSFQKLTKPQTQSQ